MKINPFSDKPNTAQTTSVDVTQPARFVNKDAKAEVYVPLLNALHLGVLCLQTGTAFEIYDEFGTLLIDSALGRQQPSQAVVDVLVLLEAVILQDRQHVLSSM